MISRCVQAPPVQRRNLKNIDPNVLHEFSTHKISRKGKNKTSCVASATVFMCFLKFTCYRSPLSISHAAKRTPQANKCEPVPPVRIRVLHDTIFSFTTQTGMPPNSRTSPIHRQNSCLEHHIHDQQITRKSHTVLRNFGATAKSHQFRCISSVLTKSRKPPCLRNSFEVFYPITKTSFQIRTLIPKVNFTYRETHSLQNAREVTQFHQSQVESHNIRYDSPTKQSGMQSNKTSWVPHRVDGRSHRPPEGAQRPNSSRDAPFEV